VIAGSALLDTSTVMRLSEGISVSTACRDLVRGAELRLLVSSVTAWEIGMLATRTGRTAILFGGDPAAWLKRFCTSFNAETLPLSMPAAVAASYLPEPFHRDPADRLLVAQARTDDLLLVTSDRNILAYAAAGHVRALAA
jgi:PIN domain nuclease of toxin-antitoxin system